MRYVVVPRDGSRLVELRAASTRGVWLAGVLEIPDINLNGVSIDQLQRRRELTSPFVAPETTNWFEVVEVQAADGTSMNGFAEKKKFRGAAITG